MKSLPSSKLTELEDYVSPKPVKTFYYRTTDGIKLRVALWNESSKKGSILLQSGRTEFIEKYFEVINEFLERDFCVAMFDWRGQGLSDRLTKDPFLGHIDNFSEYDIEFQEILTRVYLEKCPKPWIGLGHSMGGCIVATAAIDHPENLDGLILCAPMLSMNIDKKTEIVGLLFGGLSSLGFKHKPFSRPEWDNVKGWHERPFSENDVTSDENRYQRTSNLIKTNENLAVGGLSIGWAYESIKRIRKFRKKDYITRIQCPTLLLNATKDKLINANLNRKLCSKIPDITIADIEGEHELLMEKDIIRKQAWNEMDRFLTKFL